MTKTYQIVPNKSIKYLSANIYDIKNKNMIYGIKFLDDKNAPSKIAEAIAKHFKKQKISSAVYCRGKYLYHGKIKQIAESIKKRGITI